MRGCTHTNLENCDSGALDPLSFPQTQLCTLNLHNWVSELPDEIRGEITKRFVNRKLTDGEYLFRLGDPPDACFQIAKGRFKVCNFNYAGQELVHTHLQEGDSNRHAFPL